MYGKKWMVTFTFSSWKSKYGHCFVFFIINSCEKRESFITACRKRPFFVTWWWNAIFVWVVLVLIKVFKQMQISSHSRLSRTKVKQQQQQYCRAHCARHVFAFSHVVKYYSFAIFFSLLSVYTHSKINPFRDSHSVYTQINAVNQQTLARAF